MVAMLNLAYAIAFDNVLSMKELQKTYKPTIR